MVYNYFDYSDYYDPQITYVIPRRKLPGSYSLKYFEKHSRDKKHRHSYYTLEDYPFDDMYDKFYRVNFFDHDNGKYDYSNRSFNDTGKSWMKHGFYSYWRSVKPSIVDGFPGGWYSYTIRYLNPKSYGPPSDYKDRRYSFYYNYMDDHINMYDDDYGAKFSVYQLNTPEEVVGDLFSRFGDDLTLTTSIDKNDDAYYISFPNSFRNFDFTKFSNFKNPALFYQKAYDSVLKKVSKFGDKKQVSKRYPKIKFIYDDDKQFEKTLPLEEDINVEQKFVGGSNRVSRRFFKKYPLLARQIQNSLTASSGGLVI